VIERIIDRLCSISPFATGLRRLSGPNLSRAGFGSRRATTRLAPYQSPKLGVVMIQPAPEQNRLTQMTDEELMADLSRRADALGIEIIIRPKVRWQLALVPHNKSEECDG
jgi:hypothetical protein